jgi:hypothetical protein
MRRAEAILIRSDKILIAKIESDPEISRATWVFPFVDLKEDESPRKAIIDLLNNMQVKYRILDTYQYDHPENPKIKYYAYLVEALDSKEPLLSKPFVSYKWVQKDDIIKYFTSFIDAKLLELIKNISAENKIEFYP